jgi:hypothetical protein
MILFLRIGNEVFTHLSWLDKKKGISLTPGSMLKSKAGSSKKKKGRADSVDTFLEVEAIFFPNDFVLFNCCLLPHEFKLLEPVLQDCICLRLHS